ncbi:hypothetical protein MSG28_015400 [Choristoneura fumiferana]|uniref:Uncharacterized protein n=1 Tax=Choristoneura fumiferana TaxID=7141 RepID=A0ACC0KAI2_CHOFU|nr:hypothetical protein MSG28_015400 [Choristoneura fumiferana]
MKNTNRSRRGGAGQVPGGYVCSETDLRDAEVFKGVIFCSGCSQRIFQGCSTARHAKAKPRRQRERRRRERAQRSDANRVIEMARMGRSSTSSERYRVDSQRTDPTVLAPYPSVSTECYCALELLNRAQGLIRTRMRRISATTEASTVSELNRQTVKKKILMRSSLISVIVSKEKEKE